MAALVAALALGGCADMPGVGGMFSSVPEGPVSTAQAEYPNINLAPDRPSTLKSASQQQQLETELQQLEAEHVTETRETIETKNRRN